MLERKAKANVEVSKNVIRITREEVEAKFRDMSTSSKKIWNPNWPTRKGLVRHYVPIDQEGQRKYDTDYKRVYRTKFW